MRILISLSFIISTALSYSINYYSKNNGIVEDVVNGGLSSFKEAPSPEHIADIYSRVSGLAPILSEGILIDSKTYCILFRSCSTSYKKYSFIIL